MATKIDPYALDLEEQIVRIRKAQAEIDKAFEDIARSREETRKIVAETRVVSAATIFQGLIAIAALIGAGAAITKLLFP